MTDSLMITIYIALIAGGILAVLTIALQVAIFILIQNTRSLERVFGKIKKAVFGGLEVLVNPASKIKTTKTKKI